MAERKKIKPVKKALPRLPKQPGATAPLGWTPPPPPTRKLGIIPPRPPQKLNAPLGGVPPLPPVLPSPDLPGGAE